MIYSCCSSSAGEDFVGILELAEGDFEIRTNDMTETTVGTEEDWKRDFLMLKRHVLAGWSPLLYSANVFLVVGEE